MLRLYIPMCEPHPGAELGRRFDAERGRWPDHAADRDGIPRPRGDHGATDQPGQAADRGACRSTSPAISGRCCACSTSSSVRGTAETSTWRPRRSASPLPHLRRYRRSVDPP